jgi:hypothetical protein
MSRLNKRVILSVLISLGVIFAVFTSVQGASPEAAASKVGTHLVSGAQVNLNHDRFTSAELDAYNAQLDAYKDSMKGRGGGCESDYHSSPDL